MGMSGIDIDNASTQPPSIKALSDLHTLLNTNTVTSSLLSSSSCSSCSPVPLTGRKVMVPIGTKAFFSGTLQPTRCNKETTQFASKSNSSSTTTTTTTEAAASAAKEEMVVMKLGGGVDNGYYAEMDRQKACDVISRRLEAAIAAPSTRASTKSGNNDDGVSKLEAAGKKNKNRKGKGWNKGFLNSDGKKTTNKKKKKTQTMDSDANNLDTTLETTITKEEEKEVASVPPSIVKNKSRNNAHNMNRNMPFFEIREEYDSQGIEIKAEAIDVSKELKYLSKQNPDDNDNDEHEPTTNNSNEPQEEDDEQEEEIMTIPKSPTPPSSSRYDGITTRLDELSLLEEQSQTQKAANQKSAKSLQGKAWKKGFFNNNTKKNVKDEEEVNDMHSFQNQIPPNQTTSNNIKSKQNLQKSEHTNDGMIKTSKVTFGQNQTKSIPSRHDENTKKLLPKKPPQQVHGIHTNVFSGSISEKKVVITTTTTTPSNPKSAGNAGSDGGKKLSRFAQQQRMDREASSSSGSGGKKLSRFAQQRLRDREG